LTEFKPSIVGADAAALAEAPPTAFVRRPLDLRHIRELVVHLVARELALAHRGTLLGWSWPLARQLVQLGVLVFIFGHVVNLHIPHYAVFVFTGLVAWTWFATGVATASWSLITRRYLVFQPQCPPVVLPVVAVAAPVLDVVMALPVLVAMLLASGTFHWTVVLLVPLFAVQLVLMVGIAWIVAAISVYMRDVPNIVTVVLLTLFYATPVFFAISRVPERFHSVLLANPIGTLIESYRAVALGTAFPPAGALAGVVVGSVALTAVGLWVFRALEGRFVDEL
jgi:lipopolysaccharide transport system permease protein